MILPVETLQSELVQSGLTPVIPMSSHYFCPSRQFLEQEYSLWLDTERPEEYADIDKFNCTSFSMWALVELHKCLKKAMNIRGCSVASGLFLLNIGFGTTLNGISNDQMGEGGHATLLVRCNDGKWVIFEPQNCEITTLEKAQDDAAIGRVTLVLL